MSSRPPRRSRLRGPSRARSCSRRARPRAASSMFAARRARDAYGRVRARRRRSGGRAATIDGVVVGCSARSLAGRRSRGRQLAGERFQVGAATWCRATTALGVRSVGEEARRVVEVGAGVPGMGGLSTAGLADVAGEPVERRGCRGGGVGARCRLGRRRRCAPRRGRRSGCRRVGNRRSTADGQEHLAVVVVDEQVSAAGGDGQDGGGRSR